MAFNLSIREVIEQDTTGLLAVHRTWVRVRLGDVVEILNGAPFDSELFSSESGYPLVRIRDVLRGQTDTFYRGDFAPAFGVEAGDLLVGMDGDFNLGRWHGPKALLNQRVCKLTVDRRFYSERLLQRVLPGYLAAIHQNTPSITVKHLSSRTIAEIDLPLPPLQEQIRLVDKLDELLSDLDAGVAELKAAQAKLQRYRQSLLKAAVQGDLTAEWRAANPPIESGADLLQRILAERRNRWEDAQRDKAEAAGKPLPKGWQGKYSSQTDSVSGLSDLPPGWTWATLAQIGFLDRGRSKHRPRDAAHLYGGPYPFIQTGDIRAADTFIRAWSSSYSVAGLAQSRLWPVGTMCITIAATIGKTALLEVEACFPDSVVGWLPAADCVDARYVEYYMRTMQQRLEEEAPATAQRNINLETLAQVTVALPPLDEQIRIVELVDSALGDSRALHQAVNRAIAQSAAQRQNILRAAFAGELVPQDPSDEPAAELLARIRAGRDVSATTGRAAPRPRAPRRASRTAAT